MKYIKKHKYFFIALVLVLATIPFQVHALDDQTFDIVGWHDESGQNGVTSVKVNGTELSEYNSSMFDSIPEVNRVTAQAASSLNVEITLEDGYTLSSMEGGSMLCLSGVQSETDHINGSSSASSIQLPSDEWCERDQELYLAFKTERKPQTGGMISVDSIVLDVNGIECGSQINEDFSPEVSVPADSGYRIVPGSICPVQKEGMNYIENIAPYQTDSDHPVLFRLDIEDRGSYVFSEDLNEDSITVKNGKVLDCEMITSGGPDPESTVHELCLTVSGNITTHPWGKWESTGSTMHQRVCTKDSSHVETEKHVWDAGKVTREATCAKTGIRTYTCTACKATKTKTIPKPDNTLLVKMQPKGKNSFNISWLKVDGAGGYDVFFKKCNGKENVQVKKIKTIKGNKTFSCTVKGLKKQSAYKASVKAWKLIGGKKTYIRQSLVTHAYTGGGSEQYTNPKSVQVNKTSVILNEGKTFQIKASVTKLNKKKKFIPKSHAEKLRYVSTDKEIATVSKSGKITAVGKGKCKIYAVSVNGVNKAVNVTVK